MCSEMNSCGSWWLRLPLRSLSCSLSKSLGGLFLVHRHRCGSDHTACSDLYRWFQFQPSGIRRSMIFGIVASVVIAWSTSSLCSRWIIREQSICSMKTMTTITMWKLSRSSRCLHRMWRYSGFIREKMWDMRRTKLVNNCTEVTKWQNFLGICIPGLHLFRRSHCRIFLKFWSSQFLIYEVLYGWSRRERECFSAVVWSLLVFTCWRRCSI